MDEQGWQPVVIIAHTNNPDCYWFAKSDGRPEKARGKIVRVRPCGTFFCGEKQFEVHPEDREIIDIMPGLALCEHQILAD
jgi:hypothetical protein